MDRSEYEKLAAEHWGMNVKGKANPYTSLNGNMFSFLDRSGRLAVRLEADKREAHNAAYGLGPVEQYGSVMKDYVWVPEELLSDDDKTARLMADAMAFAGGLKPKATKK